MLKALGETDPNTGVKEVFFELNGAPRTVHVIDRSVSEVLSMIQCKQTNNKAGDD